MSRFAFAPFVLLFASCASPSPCPTCECESTGGEAQTLAAPEEQPEEQPETQVIPEPADDTPSSLDGRERSEVPPATPVVTGTCNLRGLPAGMHVELDEEAAASLHDKVWQWLNEDGSFGIDTRAGVLFSKSEDDSGSDDPLPQAQRAQGELACGVHARWVMEHARHTLQSHGHPAMGNGPVTCQDNVCCFMAFGEYDSAGGVVLSENDGYWTLRAVYQAADNGTLGEEHIAGQYDVVRRNFERNMRRTCRNEPR